MRKTRRTLAAVACVAAFGALAGPASAATSGTQDVVGTTLGTLALGVPATPALLDNNFAPGFTATNSIPAALLVTATDAWDLSVEDDANDGHLQAAAVGCANSSPETGNQLQVETSGGLNAVHTGVQTVAADTIGVGATVASGTLANAVTAAYSLPIASTEVMETGCVYTTTVNWTVQ